MVTTKAEENAALTRKLYQQFNEGRLQENLALVAPNVEVALIAFGQTFHGRDGFTNFMQGFQSAFPDLKITVTNQVANDDYVVNEFTARGTQTGPLLSPAGEIPPTGRTVDFTVCEVYRIENGLIASLHNYQDATALLRQLGLLP